jgi:hypothetical protein
MSLLPYGICVIGLLSVFTLGQTLQQLRPNKEEILHLFGDARIRTITFGLLVVPILIMVGLTGMIVFVLKGEVYLRAAHAALVLGLWMVLGLSLLALVMMTRLSKRPSLSTLAAPVLAVPLTAYLTPLGRFGEVFGTIPAALPLVVGMLIIIVNYFYLWQVKKELL